MRNLPIAAISAASTLAFIQLASAADAGAPADRTSPPPVAAPAYSWTGCYLGIEGGGAVGRSSHVAESGAVAGLSITGALDSGGGLVGGTVGCNYQVNVLVFGIEDDLSWTSEKGSGPDIPPFSTAATS